MIPPVVALFVWRAVAAGGSVEGFSRNTVTLYYLAVIVVNQFTMTTANWTVGDSIREGQINTLLLRPFHPLLNAAMVELAGKGVFLSFALPMAAILGIVVRPEFEFGLTDLIWSVPSVVLALLVRFSWGLWLALLAFRAARSDSLLTVQEALIDIFGGILAPIALLPHGMQVAARVLPFRYMIGFPVEVLTGTLSPSETTTGLAIQCAWLAASLLLCRRVWRRGMAHHEAVGG